MTAVTLPAIARGTRPIYLGAAADLYCLVDVEDYDFALQWKWKAIRSKGVKQKWYAFRTTRWQGRHVAFWLHKEICFRVHGLPPSKAHVIADHGDGDSLNNRRGNLAWATPSENRRNIAGFANLQLRMAVATADPSRVLSGHRGGR